MSRAQVVMCLVAALGLACAEDEVQLDRDDALDESDLVGDEGKGDRSLGPYAYHTVRRDTTGCPDCGGYWVARVNNATTRCLDGTYQAECPADELDLVSLLGFGDAERQRFARAAETRSALATGRFNEGAFRVHTAWTAATTAPAFGTYVKVVNLGIVCITTPCRHLDATELNHPVPATAPAITTGWLSSIDLGWLDLDDAQLEVAQGHLTDPRGGGLIVSGFPIIDTGNAGQAPALGATQAFFRLRAP